MTGARILFLGAPGSGKGTQAQLLADRLQLPVIATGDMLRDHVKRDTDLGVQAKSFMDRGVLVPDEIIRSMVSDAIRAGGDKGFILDGFPRNLEQAKSLARLLSKLEQSLEFVLYLDVPEEEILKRLTRRRVCPDCGLIYHLDTKPPKIEDRCDGCRSTLIHRSDDSEEVIRKRLKVYRDQTEPLVRYYRESSILRHIIAMGNPDAVFQQLAVIVESRKS